MKKLVFSLIVIAVLSGCADHEQTPLPATSEQANKGMISNAGEEGQLEVVAENLDAPWSIARWGDTIYVTERSGAIIHITARNSERHALELEKEISNASEAGLLGFVLHPDFSLSSQAYAYYSYEAEEGQFNRIVLLQLENSTWKEIQVLLDQIPSGAYHHGGRLKIGPDNKLYATAGDASVHELAQDLTSLGGKILRLELDGSIPADNPFTDSYVYSYGHRNPQGLAWSADGILYASEHGNSANDEVNRIAAGQNYGWPVIQGNETQDHLTSPLFTSGSEATWAPSGMEHHNDYLYVAALRGNAILQFNLVTNEMREVITGLGRIRDVFIEDNWLYFISNNSDGRGRPDKDDDKLYRIPLPEFN